MQVDCTERLPSRHPRWSLERWYCALSLIARTRRPGTALASPKHFKEFPEGLSVASSGLAAKQKRAIPQTHGGKIAHALPRRMMIYGGILGLRRNPHATARSWLLQVHLVQSPEIHLLVHHQLAEFFYASSAAWDRLWPEGDGACGDGT